MRQHRGEVGHINHNPVIPRFRINTPLNNRRSLFCIRQVFLQGLDNQGRPIVLGVGARHRKFDSKDDAMAFCIYALDTAVAIGCGTEKDAG